MHNLLQTRKLVGDTNTEDIVCAPIMMFHFEMMAGTSPIAWMQHVQAVASMLATQGPSNCRLGPGHEIFITVRVFTVSRRLYQSSSVSTLRLHFWKQMTYLLGDFGIAIRIDCYKSAAYLCCGTMVDYTFRDDLEDPIR